MARHFFQTTEARWVADLEHGERRAKAEAALRLSSLARERGDAVQAERLLRVVIHDGEPATAARAAFALGQPLADCGAADDAEWAFEIARGLARPELAPD